MTKMLLLEWRALGGRGGVLRNPELRHFRVPRPHPPSTNSFSNMIASQASSLLHSCSSGELPRSLAAASVLEARAARKSLLPTDLMVAQEEAVHVHGGQGGCWGQGGL